MRDAIEKTKGQRVAKRLRAAMWHRRIGLPELAQAGSIPYRKLAARVQEGRSAGKDLLPALAQVLGVPRAWIETGQSAPVWAARALLEIIHEDELRNAPYPKPAQPGSAFHYLNWMSEFSGRWRLFISNQTDPRTQAVQDASASWPPMHRSAITEPLSAFSPEHQLELSRTLKVHTPSADDLLRGHQSFNRPHPLDVPATNASMASDPLDDHGPSRASMLMTAGSAALCARCLARVSPARRKKWPHIDYIAVEHHVLELGGDSLIEDLAAVQDLPPCAFDLLSEALLLERDRRIDAGSSWADVGAALWSIFLMRLPNDPQVELIDAVKQHRRLCSGRARTPIANAADEIQGHRLLNAWDTFDGQIVQRQRVEEQYEQRRLDAEVAVGDLKELARRGIVVPLKNDYIRFLDAPERLHRIISSSSSRRAGRDQQNRR